MDSHEVSRPDHFRFSSQRKVPWLVLDDAVLHLKPVLLDPAFLLVQLADHCDVWFYPGLSSAFVGVVETRLKSEWSCNYVGCHPSARNIAPDEWSFDREDAAPYHFPVSPSKLPTKRIILVHLPHNPTGKQVLN